MDNQSTTPFLFSINSREMSWKQVVKSVHRHGANQLQGIINGQSSKATLSIRFSPLNEISEYIMMDSVSSLWSQVESCPISSSLNLTVSNMTQNLSTSSPEFALALTGLPLDEDGGK